MRMDELIRDLPIDGPPLSVDVRGITHDSRRVQRGDVFAALPGLNAHGLDFLHAAVKAGAAAVLSDADRQPGVDLP